MQPGTRSTHTATQVHVSDVKTFTRPNPTSWTFVMSQARAALLTVFLLCGSCAVMTCAWYLHLKFKHWSMRQAIVYSWCIASLEYCLMIPANRIGALQAGMSPATLRGIAEMAILTSFLLFNRLVLKQAVLWNHLVGFSIAFIGVLVVLAEPPYSGLWLINAPSTAASVNACNAEAVPDSRELFRRAFPPDTGGGKWATVYMTKQNDGMALSASESAFHCSPRRCSLSPVRKPDASNGRRSLQNM